MPAHHRFDLAGFSLSSPKEEQGRGEEADCFQDQIPSPRPSPRRAGRGRRDSAKGVLPKWNGARVSHPQQPGLPDERTQFQGYCSCRTCCGWDSRAPP
jgi:hypothetical protein